MTLVVVSHLLLLLLLLMEHVLLLLLLHVVLVLLLLLELLLRRHGMPASLLGRHHAEGHARAHHPGVAREASIGVGKAGHSACLRITWCH